MAAKGIKTQRFSFELNLNSMTVIGSNEELQADGNYKAVQTASWAWDKIPTAIQRQVSLYGLSKLLQDRISQYKTQPKNTHFSFMDEVYEVLCSGKWTAGRSGGGATGLSDRQLLAECISAVKGVEVAKVSAMLAKLEKEKVDALLAQFAGEIAERRQAAQAALADEDLEDFFDL